MLGVDCIPAAGVVDAPAFAGAPVAAGVDVIATFATELVGVIALFTAEAVDEAGVVVCDITVDTSIAH